MTLTRPSPSQVLPIDIGVTSWRPVHNPRTLFVLSHPAVSSHAISPQLSFASKVLCCLLSTSAVTLFARISLSLDFQWNTDGGTILTPHSYYEGKPFWFVIIWFCLFWWMVYFTKLYVCIQKNLLASTLTLFTGVTFLHCSIEVLNELRWAHWLCQGLMPLDWSKTPLDIFFLNLWLKSKDDNDGFKS